MRRFLLIFCSVALCSLHAAEDKSMGTVTDKIYHPQEASGADEGFFTGVSLSMVGWGIVMVTAIILTSVYLQGSNASSNSN